MAASSIDVSQQITMFQFLQAVVDDDHDFVISALNHNPLLLIQETNNQGSPLVIQSQYTWRKFYAEKALIMAARLRLSGMFMILFSYLKKLKQTEDVQNAIEEGWLAWTPYTIGKEGYDQDEIMIPEKYTTYAQSLIDVFHKESFPYGVGSECKYSEETELSLVSLLNELIPEDAIKLDDYFDPELFLLALYKAYSWNLKKLNTNQRDAFCVRVIGLVQSVLPTEIAKYFCDIGRHGKSLWDALQWFSSDEAKHLKLVCGKNFYRDSRESLSGLGGKFFIKIAEAPKESWMVGCWVNQFKSYCRKKEFTFKSNMPDVLKPTNKYGETPLHIAVKNERIKDVKTLIKKEKTDVNAADRRGWRPLHIAVDQECRKIVNALLEKKDIDVNAVDEFYRTPLGMAVKRKNLKIVNVLLKADGIEVDKVDEDGRTPLYIAAKKGYLKIVKALLQEGADPHAKTNSGETPSLIAERKRHSAIVTELTQAIERHTVRSPLSQHGLFTNSNSVSSSSSLHDLEDDKLIRMEQFINSVSN